MKNWIKKHPKQATALLGISLIALGVGMIVQWNAKALIVSGSVLLLVAAIWSIPNDFDAPR